MYIIKVISSILLACITIQSAWAKELPAFSDIYKESVKSVVRISVSKQSATKNISQAKPAERISQGRLFDFFKSFKVPLPELEIKLPAGQGSGFILSADGIVVTNAHVVEKATTVTVLTYTNKEYSAQILGTDKATDIAVLKIEGHNLPVMKLGDATKVEVGDWVMAIGAPFGFSNSASVGIISAKGRDLPVKDNYLPFFQSDVAINPGNSGGPLINSKGEAIGVNAQIFSKTGGYQGVSFAIPLDAVLLIKNQLLEHGAVKRSILGIQIQEVTDALAQAFKLPDTKNKGALVVSVFENSPAEQAGLKEGDIILQFNNTIVQKSTDLPALVALSPEGKKARLHVWKNEKEIVLDIYPKQIDTPAKKAEIPKWADGLQLRPLTEKEQAEQGVTQGLLVDKLTSQHPFVQEGLRRGDILLGTKTSAFKDLTDIYGLREKQAVLVKTPKTKKFLVLSFK